MDLPADQYMTAMIAAAAVFVIAVIILFATKFVGFVAKIAALVAFAAAIVAGYLWLLESGQLAL